MPTSRCLTRTRRRLKYATGDTFIAAPIPALRHRPRPPPIRAQPLLAVAIPSSLPGHAGPTSVNLLRYRGRLASPVSGRALPPPLTAAPGYLRPTGLASKSRPIAARALPPLGIYA